MTTLYKTPKRLGQGLEGAVYRIAPNLIEKRWAEVLFSAQKDENKSEIKKFLARYKNVMKTYHSLPADVQKYVAVPEFAGYELREDQLVTFHEYVPGMKLNLNQNKAKQKVLWKLQDNFSDAWFDEKYPAKGNVMYSKGKFYLVDVA